MDPATIALIAAGISAAGSVAGGYLSGGGDKMKKVSTQSKGQQKLHKQLFQQLQGMIGGIGQGSNILQQYLDPNSQIYQNFEKPYLQQFEQQTVPMLAERFAGAGAEGGALSSSGFGQSLSMAGANLQTNLAQMKSGLQRTAINDLWNQYMQGTNQALNTPQFAYTNQQGGGGLGPGLAQGFANISPGTWQGMAGGGGQGGGNYQAQYPLTNYYDTQFRMDPRQMGY